MQRFRSLGLGERVPTSLLYAFDAPALRLAMGHAMSKEDQEHYLADQQRAAALDLSQFVAVAGIGDVRQITRYEASTAPQEVLTAAAEERADLIVQSTHGRNLLARILIGSVTEQVLRTSPIDVMTIPPQRAE